MPITVVKEPDDLSQKFGIPFTLEKCCFCRVETRFWCEERDVACCEECAKKYSLKDVPTKEEWCEQNS